MTIALIQITVPINVAFSTLLSKGSSLLTSSFKSSKHYSTWPLIEPRNEPKCDLRYLSSYFLGRICKSFAYLPRIYKFCRETKIRICATSAKHPGGTCLCYRSHLYNYHQPHLPIWPLLELLL